jgi:hypothetical protein
MPITCSFKIYPDIQEPPLKPTLNGLKKKRRYIDCMTLSLLVNQPVLVAVLGSKYREI